MMVRRDGGSADKKSAKSLPDPSRPGRSTSVFRAIRRLASPNSQYLACIAQPRELIEQLSKRFAAVRDLNFLFGREFGKGLAKRRVIEIGVVTEAARAARLVENQAQGAAFDEGQDFAATRQDKYANVVGAPVGRSVSGGFDPAEFFEEHPVIGLVARSFSGKARGENTWGAVERLDGNPGVVGEDEPVNRAAVMQRFLRGVLAEGPAVFDNRREALHARNGFHFEATVRGGLAELAQLPRI